MGECDNDAYDAFLSGMSFFWPRDRPGLTLPVAQQGSADCCYAFVLRDIVYPGLLVVCRDRWDRGFRLESISVEDSCVISPQEFLDRLHLIKSPNNFDPATDVVPETGLPNNFSNAFFFLKQYGVHTETQYPFKGKVQVYEEPKLDLGFKIFVERSEKIVKESKGLVVQWLNKQPLTGSLLIVPSLTGWMKEVKIYAGPTEADMDVLEAKKKEFLRENPNKKWIDPKHAVAIVGYGIEGGVAYYVCKNSWGPTWGCKGYIKIARDVVTNIRRPIRPYRSEEDPHSRPK